MSSVRIGDIVVGEREVPLFPVPLRISSNQDAWLLVWSESVFVLELRAITEQCSSVEQLFTESWKSDRSVDERSVDAPGD
jgi:hypothetical protein